MAEEQQKKKYLTFEETTYYSIKDIKEAVDIVIGDDGFRSKEIIQVLNHFHHIHFPMIIDNKCSINHEEEKGEKE